MTFAANKWIILILNLIFLLNLNYKMMINSSINIVMLPHDGIYLALKFYFICTCLLCLLIFISSYFFSQEGDLKVDKTTPYECGFEAFGDARDSFDIKYYLIGIIFLIFDLELIFLLPWVICITKLNIIGILSMMFFIFILTTGFIFEWKKGSLDW